MEQHAIAVKEMAASLGISLPTAYNLVNRDDFPKIRIGKKILIPCQAFQVWLEKEARHGGESHGRVV